MTNEQKRQRGEQLMEFYASMEGTDADSPQDIIADLLHACGDRHSMGGAESVHRQGWAHFYEEVTGGVCQ